MLNCWPWVATAHTVHWLRLSSVHAAVSQTKQGKLCFLRSVQVPFHPYAFCTLAYTHVYTHTQTHTHIHLCEAGHWDHAKERWKLKKRLAPGDRDCPIWISEWQNLSIGCMRGYLSHCVGGWRSNEVILSLTIPIYSSQHAANTEFTDKVANFHPYCSVRLHEKWTIGTAGMCWCFWRSLQQSPNELHYF